MDLIHNILTYLDFPMQISVRSYIVCNCVLLCVCGLYAEFLFTVIA